MKNKKNSRILFLDYMRIIAFSVVVAGHKFHAYFSKMWLDQDNSSITQFIYGFFYKSTVGGALGVVLFFLVSGYIITHVLQYEKTSEFYLKRIFRIYPLYIFVLLLELYFTHTNGTPYISISIFIQRALLIGDFFNTPLSLGGVEWTLRIEIVFYLFMGILNKLRLLNNGNITSICLLLVAYFIYILPPFPKVSDFHYGYFSIYIHFLFIGVIIYYLDEKRVNLFLAILCISMMFYFHLYLLKEYSPMWSKYNFQLYAMIIFLLSCRCNDKFISFSAFAILSDLTYSIYLFHDWTWSYIYNFVFYTLSIRSVIFINTMIIISLFIICFISNYVIEKNGIRIGKIIKTKFSNLR